ncbi:MAG: hypothetical protein ACRDYY_11645 [Acidimicrobiales bacterium]
MLLLTIVLVLAGLVLLIIGFVENTLGYIYASIICAAVAGLALIVFSRLSRRAAVRLAAAGGFDAPAGRDQAGVPSARQDVASPSRDPGAGDAFPIDDYDSLRVSDILPLLRGLGRDQLLRVRDREATGKNRSTVIDRIDEMAGQGARRDAAVEDDQQ